MAWWQICLILLCAACALLAFAASIFVSFKFASLAISLDINLFRELQINRELSRLTMQPSQVPNPANESKENAAATTMGQRLQDFLRSRVGASDGDFVPYSDEQAFLNEQVDGLRAKGMSQEELDTFVKQAINTDIGSVP